MCKWTYVFSLFTIHNSFQHYKCHDHFHFKEIIVDTHIPLSSAIHVICSPIDPWVFRFCIYQTIHFVISPYVNLWQTYLSTKFLWFCLITQTIWKTFSQLLVYTRINLLQNISDWHATHWICWCLFRRLKNM